MRPTIAQLEELLNRETTHWGEDTAIEILPNGEIRAVGAYIDGASQSEAKLKPLTFRENLGGEYAA